MITNFYCYDSPNACGITPFLRISESMVKKNYLDEKYFSNNPSNLLYTLLIYDYKNFRHRILNMNNEIIIY